MQSVEPGKKKRLVACPQCNGLSEYSTENAYRPFCCERCSLIDLGQWASEGYRVPVQPLADGLPED